MEHNVEEVTLGAGTKGLLIDVPGSKVINVKVYFRAGFQFGDFSKYEAPHLIEHHVFNGTKAFPENNGIIIEMERNGASRNAFTSSDYIGYWFECADFEAGRMLELLTELVARPIFPAEHYDTERSNVRSELQRFATEWSSVAVVRNSERNFPWRSLDYVTRIEQLDSITHDDVVAHYRATHHARNAVFAVTGAVDGNREAILAGLEALFGELEPGEPRKLRDDIGLGQEAPAVQAEDIKAIYYSLGWYAEGGDRPEGVALRLLKALLTDGRASRVFGRARREGLAYSIWSGFGHSRESSSFGFLGFADPDKLPSLLGVIAAEAAGVAEAGIDEEALEAARKRLIGNITVGTQTVSSISSWYIGDYAFDGTVESYDAYFRLINEVGPEQVRQAAQKLLLSERHSSCFVGPLDEARGRELEALLKPVWR